MAKASLNCSNSAKKRFFATESTESSEKILYFFPLWSLSPLWLGIPRLLVGLATLSLFVVSWPAKSPARQSYGGPAKEYVLRLAPAEAGVELRFVPQGEKGYVVKQTKRTAGISALTAALFLEEGRVQPVGGLDHQGRKDGVK